MIHDPPEGQSVAAHR